MVPALASAARARSRHRRKNSACSPSDRWGRSDFWPTLTGLSLSFTPRSRSLKILIADPISARTPAAPDVARDDRKNLPSAPQAPAVPHEMGQVAHPVGKAFPPVAAQVVGQHAPFFGRLASPVP